MQPRNVVLLQSDSEIARSLVSVLSGTFRSVQVVRTLGELRASIAKQREGIAILDMESTSIPEIAHLSRDFPGASIVCTHRCADEEMWAAALNAGACDMCPSTDTRGILRAAIADGGARSAAA